ncbi:hypothetical protein [Schlesneria sp. T3-172]|uniref:hypothetical protein n=1 Tax=Schlesneria sphaerica TaxID=3373610 RepID=UPI0037CB8D90
MYAMLTAYRETVSVESIPALDMDRGFELTAKGQAYLDRHFAEREGRPLTLADDPVDVERWNKKPEFQANLKPYEFSSLDEVTNAHWFEIYRRLVGHSVRMIKKFGAFDLVPQHVAAKVIENLQDGTYDWDYRIQPNLLQHTFSVARGVIRASALKSATPANEGPVRRHRRRGSGITRKLARVETVKGVIEQLPTIALLVSRLNDLLNPVAEPQNPPTMSPVGRIAR